VNAAVSESVPTGKVVVAVEAVPPVTVTGLPMGVLPTSNWTVPVALDGVTVALNETEVPENCGLAGVGVFKVVEVVMASIV